MATPEMFYKNYGWCAMFGINWRIILSDLSPIILVWFVWKKHSLLLLQECLWKLILCTSYALCSNGSLNETLNLPEIVTYRRRDTSVYATNCTCVPVCTCVWHIVGWWEEIILRAWMANIIVMETTTLGILNVCPSPVALFHQHGILSYLEHKILYSLLWIPTWICKWIQQTSPGQCVPPPTCVMLPSLTGGEEILLRI